MSKDCPKCGEQLKFGKFSDVVVLENVYFDVYVTACSNCRYVDDVFVE
jgi:C4-type Zn-finger protein